MDNLNELLIKIRECSNCAAFLPLGVRPILRVNHSAKLLIIGQAPGIRVHNSGIPWNDRSGDRLREWLAMDKVEFYNHDNIAIMPMGFCYPGINKNGGDNPPRRECAPKWHKNLLDLLPNIKLVLLVGSYAQKYYLKTEMQKTMWLTVRLWHRYLPYFFPLPHPSWRNNIALQKNGWFYTELVPELQVSVKKTIISR
ncbi:Uracil DNA glycosylase superfamily protein [Rickettsiales bacterium Ac37b]|nr:Uracil DNA glycosylase superfamily protein [Rickettsiales bacterium Ac37b]